MTTWAVGSDVVVRTLGDKRGVVVEAGRNGRYVVRVEGLITSCRESDLAAPPASKDKKRSAARRPPPEPARGDDDAGPAARVDLHGLSVEAAIEKTIDEIDRALRSGASRLEVVHGRGSGRIRAALHQQLPRLRAVKSFHLDARNPGVTWVCF